jgi:2-hydroxy-6-oxonona-2,4-dienedioate hydrolase
MTAFQEEHLDVRGTSTRVVRAGSGARTVVFVHGGMAGVTPFCCGSHLWVNAMPLFVQQDSSIVAIDFPGHGGTNLPAGALPTIEQQAQHLITTLECERNGAADLIGHDEGALVALNVAIDRPDLVRSVVVVASGAAAPSGDLPENLALASPPVPLWSRESQGWALARLSPSPQPYQSILDACVAASKGEPHLASIRLAAEPMYATKLRADVLRAKAKVFATCRDGRIPVPVQLVWGGQDPLVNVDQGLVLYRLISADQPTTTFHVLAGAGHLVFNDRPAIFHSTVSAFHAGLDNGRHG